MNLLDIFTSLESNDDLHLARLLILIGAFVDAEGTPQIEGLTKLAKLDFLLRYPVYLERALKAKKRPISTLAIVPHERISVESRMVRYKYGPWDHRYRRFINLMVARGMADVSTSGRTIKIVLTPQGKVLSEQLASSEAFKDTAARAKTLKTHFNLTGTTLMRFVYDTFPEIASLSLNEQIEL